MQRRGANVIIQKVVLAVIGLQGMNQSGWNTGEKKIRGRGDFRITPEKCEKAQKNLDARKTGLEERIKNTGGRRAGWALGIMCRCVTQPLRRGEMEQSPRKGDATFTPEGGGE